MSDTTTLYEKCVHNRLERHPLPGAEPMILLGLAGVAYSEADWCPGGRERTFEQVYGSPVGRRTHYDFYEDEPVWVEVSDE